MQPLASLVTAGILLALVQLFTSTAIIAAVTFASHHIRSRRKSAMSDMGDKIAAAVAALGASITALAGPVGRISDAQPVVVAAHSTNVQVAVAQAVADINAQRDAELAPVLEQLTAQKEQADGLQVKASPVADALAAMAQPAG